MNFVEPIRDPKKLAQIKNLLKGQQRYRDLLLFVVGINTALRVSDLLALRVGQFWDEQGYIRRKFTIHEEKRGKRNDVVMNDSICEALALYQAAYPSVLISPDHYVFFSTKTGGYDQPLGRKQAWKFITALCAEVGLRGSFGTHTLRKTWGYHARMKGWMWC